MKKINGYRILFYFLGMVCLAFGLMLNSKVNLGVSPITTISFAISNLYPFTFSDMTLVLYCILVAMEIVIHIIKKKRKSYFLLDLAQIPFSIIFTRFMSLFSGLIPSFANDLPGTIYAGIPFRLCMLAIAITCTGVGAITMLDMALIPNPGDGIVQAIASLVKKDIPSTKVWFDCSCIIIAVIICFVHGAGIIGVNIGTIIAMLCTGRVMGIYNKFAFDFYNKFTGM